jgi:sodium/hydrogen antiporter
VLGLVDLSIGAEPVKLLAEATLTLVLFADASRISLPALPNEFAVPLRLLAIGLPLTILAGMVAGVAVLPGISLVEALVLSIMLACTDAALGQAVVTDERIRRGSGKGSTSRAASTTASAFRSSSSHSPLPRQRRGH